ncbi:MAG: hypothetical protein JF603_11370 [Acidobacteria bacterium]|nr:hypothetical protein [Acidobacteriota bacterium]
MTLLLAPVALAVVPGVLVLTTWLERRCTRLAVTLALRPGMDPDDAERVVAETLAGMVRQLRPQTEG